MEVAKDFCRPAKKEGDDTNLILKIKSVLLKLSTPGFRISDDTILQKLYDCIAQIFSVEDGHDPLMEIFLPWISAVIKDWNCINQKSCSFAVRILALICSKEKDFCMLLNSKILIDIQPYFKSCKDDNFSNMLAFLNLIKEVISHECGCLWILESGIWKDVLSVAKNNQSIYVLKEAHNVIVDLITATGAQNLTACQCIIDEVFLPCLNEIKNDNKSLKSAYTIRNMPYRKECFNENLNYLNSIVLIRETILRMMDRHFSHIHINSIFEKYNLIEWIYSNIGATENVRLIVELSRLLCTLNISHLPRSENRVVKYSDMTVLYQNYLEHCKQLVSKGQFILLQEVCIEYFKLWNKFGGEVIYDIKEHDASHIYSLDNSIFLIMTIPLFIYIKIGRADLQSDLKEAYAERIFGVACVQTKRIGFLYKNVYRERMNLNDDEIALSTVHCFVRITDICKKEQAVMIFQTLVHFIQKLIPSNDIIDFPDLNKSFGIRDIQNVSVRSPELLSATLEALHCYISRFDITWSESLETLCIMPLLQKLVSPMTNNLTPKIYSQTLKVEKVVLLGYLPTNLALLMNTLQGSSLHFLGKQTFRLLHSVHWEVRDSSLELLQAICSLAEHKIPVFQTMLLEDELPNLVVSMFENDTEAYVRASALSCLNFMVRMQEVWDKALVNQALIEKLLNSVINDPEGIVRQKIILLLKEIYDCGRARTDEVEKMMDTLYHVTITDLHWEVKTAAIVFWDSVLEKKLTDVGMVDGNFPDHIFSREKRKIIKITPLETSSRIKKVFESLSNFGCLHALWHTVQDDCDLEVTRETGKLITKMLDLIHKFQVPISKENEILHNGPDSDNMEVKKKVPSLVNGFEIEENNLHEGEELNILLSSSDEVIESIVSEGDLSLLCGLIKQMRPNENPTKLLPRVKMSLDKFYNAIVSYDFIGKQLQKARWLYKTSEGINSLLEDIYAANQLDEKESNIFDCY